MFCFRILFTNGQDLKLELSYSEALTIAAVKEALLAKLVSMAKTQGYLKVAKAGKHGEDAGLLESRQGW